MDDLILENDESFIVSLSTTDGAVNILRDQTVVTITDNDSMYDYSQSTTKKKATHYLSVNIFSFVTSPLPIQL